MTIELEKTRIGWRADWAELPGTPRVGVGTTRESAVADLFRYLVDNSNAYNHLLRALPEPVEFVIVRNPRHSEMREVLKRYR